MSNQRNNNGRGGQKQLARPLPRRGLRMGPVLGLSSVLVSGQADPPPVQWTIEHSYLARLLVSPAGATDVAITPAMIVATVPGGATAWQQLRIQKISVYAPADASGYVRLTIANLVAGSPSENPAGPGDGKVFDDFGTQGQRRPQVHVRPNLAFRDYWWNDIATSESPVCSVNHGTAGQLLCYFSLQLRSVQRAP